MKDVSKHRQISRELIAELASGKYDEGGKLPSEAQLVKRFGVSRPTVIRALRDLQVDGLVVRRAGSGTFVKRREGAVAETRKLGLLIPERGSTEIFELIAGELSRWARAHDYALLFGGSLLAQKDEDMSHQHALAMCHHFVAQRTLGVFFAPFEAAADRDRINEKILETLTKAGIPLVLIDRDPAPFPMRSEFDLIATDNFAGGYLLAEHLIRLGCKNIAYLTRPTASSTVEARIAGTREAMIRYDIPVSADWVRTGDPRNPGFVRSAILERRVEGVVCAHDLVAAELMRTVEQCGAKVPGNLRVVGFDDAKYASLLGVSLTTMHQPSRDIARAAFDALVERIADPARPVRSLLLTPRIVVRESCGAFAGREISS